MKKLAKQIRNNIAQRKKNRRLTTILTAIAGILVFITVYTLILPALALEQDVHCGKEAHEHTDACYEEVLKCGREEHAHDEGCCDEDGNLICGKEEHSHDESCYESKLVCGKERHVHTESCYKNPEAEELTNAGTQMQNEKSGTSVSEEDKTDSNSTETVNNKKEDKNTSSDSKKDNKTDKDNKVSADQNEIVQGQEEKLVTMDISDYMTDDTGLWYYRPSEKAKASWKEVDKDTTLRKKDLVCLHLALRFKKGAVTDNISETVYELPENVEITDVVAKWLNDDDHGMNQLILGKSTPDKNSKGKKYLAGKYEIAKNKETDKWELTVDWDSYMITQNAKKPMDVWADMYVTAKALKPMEDNSNKVVFAEKTKNHKEISAEYAAVKDETDKRKGALAINLSDYMTMGTGMWYYRASDKEKASWNRVREGSVLKEKDLVCIHLAMRFKKGTVTKATYDTKYTLPANIEFTDVIANWHNNEDRGMDQLILGVSTPDNPLGSKNIEVGTYSISQNENTGNWLMTVDWNSSMISENAEGDVNVWADLYVTGKSLMAQEDGSNIVIFSNSNQDDRVVATVFDGVEKEDKESEDQSARESGDQSDNESAQDAGAEDIGAGADQQPGQDTGEESTTEGEKVEEGSETTTAAEPADEATTEAVDATAPADETNTEAAPETSTGSSEDTTEAPAAPVDPKDQAVAGDLFYDGPDYTVSVSYGPEAGLPADVKLDVREIKEDSQSKAEQKEYADYFDQASEAIHNENKANVKTARFFDITFMRDQKQIEPTGPVNVKIEYKQAEAIEENQEVAAVHLPDKADNEVLDVDVQKTANGVKEVEFTADNFSVYGIVYTVDFEYESDGQMYTFSIAGGTSISINDLLIRIGKCIDEKHAKEFSSNIKSIRFSNEELVRVAQADRDMTIGDIVKELNVEQQFTVNLDENEINSEMAKEVSAGEWWMISLKPFTSEESLVITLKDGSQVIVKVMDAAQTTNLNDLIQSFYVNGATLNADGTYSVKPGKEYSVNMRFAESETSYQFSDSEEMVFTLPEGIELKGMDPTFNVAFNSLGTEYTISGNTARIEGNKLYLKFNTTAEHFDLLKQITTTEITVNASVVFNNKQGQTIYEVTTDGTYKIDSTPDVNINKSGKVTDFDRGIVEYTLDLISNGSNSGITVTDTIKGDALTLNQDVKMYDSNGNVVSSAVVTYENNKFVINTGELTSGNYKIKYTASLDKEKLDVDGGALGKSDDTKNTVEWLDQHKDYDLGHIVENKLSWKYGNGSSTNDSTGIATTKWTIVAHSRYTEDSRLKNVTDTIKTEGVHYSGDGISVKITDITTNNVVGTVNLSWAQLGVNKETATTWSYDMSQLPGYNNEGKYWKYEINYYTEYYANSLESPLTIVNEETTNNDPNPHEGTSIVQPTSQNRTEINKSVIKTEADSITWRIDLTIPKKGVAAEKSVVKEELPGTGKYQDTYIEGSFKYISGNLEGDGIPVIENTDSKTVTFSWRNGFVQSSNQRHVIFEFQTKNDVDWMNDLTVTTTHKNHAIFNGNDSWAETNPVKPTFKKFGSQIKEENGQFYIDFEVKMNTITEESFSDGPIVFTDTFDDHLEYVAGSARIYSGDDINNISQYYNHCNPTVQTSGNTIKFTVTRDNLPGKHGQNADGSWGEQNVMRTFYKLTYRMKVKNKENLINEALSKNNYTVIMGNKVTSKVGEDETEVKYTPKVLDKYRLGEQDGKIKFEIKVNEVKADLVADSDVLVLTDTMSNLSAHYQDITIDVKDYDVPVTTKDGAGNDVTLPYFNMKGDTITFYLPDNHTTVITYYAKAVGTVSGDGLIHYSNTAKLNGYKKTLEQSSSYSGHASGVATNYGVKLYKANGYVNSQMLAGAKFKLYIADEVDEDGNIVSGTPMKNIDGTDFIVTSSSDGAVEIKGDANVTGWNLKPEQRYYIQEVQAPPGCAIDNTKYSFVISQKGYVNYSAKAIEAPDGSGAIVQPWTYYNGDVLTVKNWPKEGELVLSKNFQGIDPSNLDDDQKAAIKFVVYKQIANGSFEEIKTVTYDQFTGTTYTIGDLSAGTYKVVEYVDDIDCKQTTYAVTNNVDSVNNSQTDNNSKFATVVISEEDINEGTPQHTVNVTNKYEIPSQFKIYKYADYAPTVGLKDMKLAGAEFGVFEYNNGNIGNQIGNNYKTNSRGRLNIEPVSENLSYDTVYAFKELVAPDGYQLSDQVYYFCFLSQGNSNPPAGAPSDIIAIPFGQSSQKDIPNTPGKTSIGVEKIWLNEFLEQDNNKTDSVNVKIKRIASYDKNGIVTESSESGYYPNMEFKVSKEGDKWRLSTDGSLPEGVSIDSNGRLTGLPTMKFLSTGVPLYYTYQVEEIPVDGYTPTYKYDTTEDGTIIATISNKPNSVKSTIKLKAQKKWVDTNGTDITDEMSYSDNVDVDVYRVVGVLKEGEIIEADGTKKDPNDQHAMTVSASGDGTLETASILFLPGDQIKITMTPIKYYNNKSFESDDVNARIVVNYQNLPYTKDAEKEEIICTFTVDDSMKALHIFQDSGQYQFIAKVENLSSEGRTQVLTQEQALDVGGTKVQTLNLNKQKKWFAESDEFAGGSGSQVYSYYLVEPKGSNYNATYTVSGDTVIVTNTDKKLKVDKKWFKSDGTTEVSNPDGEIYFNLYQVENEPLWSTNYSSSGNRSLDLSDFHRKTYNGPCPFKVIGNATDGKIKDNSTIRITISTTNEWNDKLTGEISITGGEIVKDLIVEQRHPTDEYGNTAFDRRTRTILINSVNGNIVLSGSIYAPEDENVLMVADVIKEPTNAVAPSGEALTRTPVGRVKMTKNDAVIFLSESFAGSNIKVSPGVNDFSSVISKLPETGENGVTYTYYVTEDDNALNSDYELDAINTVPAQLGDTVTIKNKKKPAGELTIKKVVDGASGQGGKTYKVTVQNDNKYVTADGKLVDNETILSVAQNQPLTISNLPLGHYVVKEVTGDNNTNVMLDGYKFTSVPGNLTGSVTFDENHTEDEVTITNKYEKGITVTKAWGEGVTPRTGKEINRIRLALFSASKNDPTKIHMVGDSMKVDSNVSTLPSVASDGSNTKVSSDGWTASWWGLDFDQNYYYVIEYIIVNDQPVYAGDDVWPYNTSYVYSGTKLTPVRISYGGSERPFYQVGEFEKNSTELSIRSITINNDKPPTGALKITKSVTEGLDQIASDKTFTFSVNLKNADGSSYTGEVKITDKDHTNEVIQAENGNVTVNVLGTGTVTIDDLPVGTTYSVTEPLGNLPEGWIQDGEIAYGDGSKTISANDEDTATVNNTFTKFGFSKEWRDVSNQRVATWPANKEITVVIHRKIGENVDTTWHPEYVIKESDLVINKEISASEGNYPKLIVKDKDSFSFEITGIKAGTENGNYLYYVVETPKVDGYQDAAYFRMQTVKNNNGEDKQVLVEAENKYALNGEYIVNSPETAVELPNTGGIGTDIFRFAGIMLIALGTVLYGIRTFRRRRQV